jgi:hypothetical protein
MRNRADPYKDREIGSLSNTRPNNQILSNSNYHHQNPNINIHNNNSSANSTTSSSNVSAVGEKRRLKVQIIQNNPNTPTANSNIEFFFLSFSIEIKPFLPHLTVASLQINPKGWPNLKVNDLLEISLQNTIVMNASNASNLANIGSSQLNTSLNRSSNNSVVSSSITTNIHGSSQQQQSQQLSSGDQDESSPFLLQVLSSSFSEAISHDIIRIDNAASSAPFSIRNLSYVNVTVVEKSVN